MRALDWLHGVPLLWRGLSRRRELERELDDEFLFHREQLLANFIAQGLPPDAAALAARRAMFGARQRQEACRDTWHVAALDRLRRDVGFAARRWRRTPASTAAALLTLALAIGANTAIFSVVNGVLLKTPPLPNASRVVWMVEQTPRGEPNGVSALNFADWQSQNRVFEQIVALDSTGTMVLGDSVNPLQVRGIAASAGYFDIFGIKPLIGRTFRAEESQPGQDRVVLLSYDLWTSRFDADPGVVGRTIRLRGEPTEVVGVMGHDAGTIHWGWAQVWTPLVIRPDAQTRSFHRFNTYALLKPGVSLAAARADMAGVSARLAEVYPETNQGWTARIDTYGDTLIGPELKQSLALLSMAVLGVLLIGCVNLANLALTQGLTREREVAIRCALGGGRARLVNQLLTEQMALGIVGGVLGIGLGYAGIAVLRSVLPAFSAPGRGLPPSDLVAMDGRVLAFTIVASLVSGVLFGLMPALTSTRVNLVTSMKEAGAGAPTPAQRGRLRSLAIVAQTALAFVLLTTTIGLTAKLSQLLRTDIGADPGAVITANLPLSQAQALDAPDRRAAYLAQLLEAAAALPGASHAALASVLPVQGVGSELPIQTDATASLDLARAPTAFFKMVTPDYFGVVGQPLILGRPFAATDDERAPKVAVINQALADAHFGGTPQAIGKRILIPQIVAAGSARLGPLQPWQIIGVIPTERVKSLTDTSSMFGVYVPLAQSPTRRPALVVRARSQPAALQHALVRAIAQVNNDQALTDIRTLDQIKDDYVMPQRQRTYLVMLFAIAALLLAGVGVYGVTNATVVQQRREIGIRGALGASPTHALVRVLTHTAVVTVWGLALGVASLAVLLTAFTPAAFGFDANTGAAVVGAGVALTLVSLLGCAIPAWRATRVSPLEAIRQ